MPKTGFSSFGQRLNKHVQAVTQKLALDTLSGLIKQSPVGNPDSWQGSAPKGYTGGRFRANWQIDRSLNSNEIDSTDFPRVPLILSVSNTYYIFNNSPYGQALNAGHSSQAPKYFVQKEVQRVANQ